MSVYKGTRERKSARPSQLGGNQVKSEVEKKRSDHRREPLEGSGTEGHSSGFGQGGGNTKSYKEQVERPRQKRRKCIPHS